MFKIAKKQFTKWRMLKRECCDVFDPLKWLGLVVSLETFRNDKFDTAQIVTGMPKVLCKKLPMERWKPKSVKLAMFVNILKPKLAMYSTPCCLYILTLISMTDGQGPFWWNQREL